MDPQKPGSMRTTGQNTRHCQKLRNKQPVDSESRMPTPPSPGPGAASPRIAQIGTASSVMPGST
eukprot:765930-Hanusia_phi.AAC.2